MPLDANGNMIHYHCPRGHIHPQNFRLSLVDNSLTWFCGTCWFLDGDLMSVVDCVPGENC